MSVFYFLGIAFFLLLCLVLTVTVLIQESKSMGFGASFGGDSGDSLFGVSTPEILKTFTGWAAAIFMSSCIILSFWTSSRARTTMPDIVQTEVTE